MNRTITIPFPPTDTPGRAVVVPVLVDWFPPLTLDQILQNTAADLHGRPRPHPDPNLIKIVMER